MTQSLTDLGILKQEIPVFQVQFLLKDETKPSKRLRLQILLSLAKGLSIPATAQNLGCKTKAVTQTIHLFNLGGLKDLIPKPESELYDPSTPLRTKAETAKLHYTELIKSKDELLRFIQLEGSSYRSKRLKAILWHSEEVPIPEIAHRLALSPSTVQACINKFNQRGLKGLFSFDLKKPMFLNPLSKDSQSEIQKLIKDPNCPVRLRKRLQVILWCFEGTPKSEVARRLSLSPASVQTALNQFNQYGLKNLLTFHKRNQNVAISDQMTPELLEALFLNESDPVLKERLEMVLLYSRGMTLLEISHKLKRNLWWVFRIVKKFKQEGVRGLSKKGKVALSDDQIEKIKELIIRLPWKSGFSSNRWKWELLSKYAKTQWDLKISPSHLRRQLPHLRLPRWLPSTRKIAEFPRHVLEQKLDKESNPHLKRKLQALLLLAQGVPIRETAHAVKYNHMTIRHLIREFNHVEPTKFFEKLRQATRKV